MPPSTCAHRSVHPLIEAAGRRAEFPRWAELSDRRRAHVERVAALLGLWAASLGLSEGEKIRWQAAGRLHDALKDAAVPALRELVDDDSWPEPLLHGPAVSARLAREGVDDEEFLLAVACHSVGHPSFRALGEHLYLADYLDPGRPEANDRQALRDAMPAEREAVLPRVILRRIEQQLATRRPILSASIDFWNRTVET